MKTKAAWKPSKRNEIVSAELERIRQTNGGRLTPIKVVDSARPKSSKLHAHFEWNDGKAAEQYRLVQARDLIRSVEAVFPTKVGPVVAPMFTSLRAFRGDKKGYMSTVEVVSNERLRAAMLREALEDLQVWEERYKRLESLQPIREAANRVRKSAGLRT